MCSTYIDSVGYICNDCQAEFQMKASGNPKYDSEERIMKGLKKFMDTRKESRKMYDNGDLVYEFFKKYSI